jgi:hypothetical protein
VNVAGCLSENGRDLIPPWPTARPPIGVGGLTVSLRTALRGDRQVAACRDFADPFVPEDNGVLYAYSRNSDGVHVPVLSSAGSA